MLPAGWTLDRCSDEFDGTGLDHDRWTDFDPVWDGRAPSRFDRRNVGVAGGRLVLQSRAAQAEEAPARYLTSVVKSRALRRYGYFEVLARPGGSSVSSAFWLYAKDARRWTEIDVFEVSAGPGQARALHTNAHVFHDLDRGRPPGAKVEFQQTHRLAFDLDRAFHVYGLKWSAQRLEWWLDGRLLRSMPNAHWHSPLNIVLDSEVFADWFGLPEPSKLPARFEIDYLRAWSPEGLRT